jgi:hypothetical protein
MTPLEFDAIRTVTASLICVALVLLCLVVMSKQ